MCTRCPKSQTRFLILSSLLLVVSLIAVVGITGGQRAEPNVAAEVHGVIPAPTPLPVTYTTAATPAVDLPESAAKPIPHPVPALPAPSSDATGRESMGDPAVPAPAIWAIALSLVLSIGMIVGRRRMRSLSVPIRVTLIALVALPLAACGTSTTIQRTESPHAYLNGALDWIQTHSAFRDRVDWIQVRRDARAMARHPRTTSDVYPAITFAVEQLREGNAFFLPANDLQHAVDAGFRATYPAGLVTYIEPHTPAARSGLHLGDIVESVNGHAPTSFERLPSIDTHNAAQFHLVVRRSGQPTRFTITFKGVPKSAGYQCGDEPRGRTIRHLGMLVGYLVLPQSCLEDYTTIGQRVIRSIDKGGPCGWIIDLRQNPGGDVWSYLAAIGPIMGEGKLGGFVYPNGRRESWVYRNGTIRWNGAARAESQVEGSVYAVKHPMPPIAVLISRSTVAAGELTAVALHGRPRTRFFGQATAGFPMLTVTTTLSDGAFLALGGAFSQDRTGRIYRGPIEPDRHASTDWTTFGSEADPPVRAALRWLQGTPQCAAI